MTDIFDRATEREEKDRELALKAAMQRAAEIPAGNPGECDLCGEFCGRLVQGSCARCRDKWGLK